MEAASRRTFSILCTFPRLWTCLKLQTTGTKWLQWMNIRGGGLQIELWIACLTQWLTRRLHSLDLPSKRIQGTPGACFRFIKDCQQTAPVSRLKAMVPVTHKHFIFNLLTNKPISRPFFSALIEGCLVRDCHTIPWIYCRTWKVDDENLKNQTSTPVYACNNSALPSVSVECEH